MDVHERRQRLKAHPLFAAHLEGGELVEWGAKTIPEGGYYALPERLSGDRLIIVGDAAGLVNVPALKGVRFYTSFVVLDPQGPSGISRISPNTAVTIQ